MLSAIALTAPFFMMILIGYIAQRIFKKSEGALEWLNLFVIYIALPALFFQNIRNTPLTALNQSSFFFITTGITGLVFLFTFLMARRKNNRGESTILGLVGSYSNIGYMAPGLTVIVLGSQATLPAALIFCFDVLLLFTITPIFMGNKMGHKASLLLTISRTTKEIIFHPFIIAVLVALIAAMIKLELPIWLDITLDNLKSAAAPCALFSMGVTLARQAFVVVKPILGFALLVKLIIHPLLIAICLIIFDVFDPVWVWTAVLMASLPPAANVYIMARRADQSIQLAGNAVLIGTVISCISVPIVIQFIQYNLML